ncbi:hypothetical protein AMAG_03112 [Allomyces macrogynus ATCC 38327]|uniref:UspA domain-containing protein n=1 Tax=Allomyces macrogynus (strain ATCC 38327) TaxID=578462 RepID=A0A0L0S4L0_ALLM3|nr:hypothetical protein AMAG_03112 [Allomyces macrogynus ATCC 38327]|eukprot:KNE57390.1 hypothetical protein AMAG_03112 [Allomyces macrogynus ATCC 38327]
MSGSNPTSPSLGPVVVDGKNIIRIESLSEVRDWTMNTDPVEGKPLAARRKVLLCYDTSRPGDQALQWLFDNLLRDGEDHVVILTCVEPNQLFKFNFLSRSQDELRSKVKAKYAGVQAVQDAFASLCHKRGISTQSLILDGDARDVILEVADRTHAQVIVMGARGVGAVHRAVLGSTSLFVTQQANVPVVIVKNSGKTATAKPTSTVTSPVLAPAEGADVPVLPLERTETLGSMLDWLSLKEKSIERRRRQINA